MTSSAAFFEAGYGASGWSVGWSSVNRTCSVAPYTDEVEPNNTCGKPATASQVGDAVWHVFLEYIHQRRPVSDIGFDERKRWMRNQPANIRVFARGIVIRIKVVDGDHVLALRE
jgi:hypothetical protein